MESEKPKARKLKYNVPKAKIHREDNGHNKVSLYGGSSKQEQLESLYNDWYKCTKCQLSEFRVNEDDGTIADDIVFGSGNPDADILIVGEAPGKEEDKHGVPFVGDSGKLLNQILAGSSNDPEIKDLALWYSKKAHTKENTAEFHNRMFEWRDKNFFFTNIIGCRPPDNRTPIPPEIKACNPRLTNLIYIMDPKLIVAVGKTAAEALIMHKIEIRKFRGELFDTIIPGRMTDLRYPTLVTLHPSYLLRTADWEDEKGEYAKTLEDFALAFNIVDFLKQKSM